MQRSIKSFITFFLLSGSVFACSVPVFRYALERWEQDLYPVFVFYDEKIGKADIAKAKQLAELAAKTRGAAGQLGTVQQNEPAANLSVTLVDVSEEVKGFAEMVWRVQEKPQLPWCVVRYPRRARVKEDIWAGPLGKAPVEALVHSPKRTEIAGRLLKGESVVWVFMEGKSGRKNRKAFRTLKKGIDSSMAVLELPEMTEDDIREYLSELRPDVRLSLGTVTVRKNEPAEKMFRRMLFSTEPLIAGKADEPAVFAFFGRGRSLYGLSGKGISVGNILDANAFLTGPCACTVKGGNPGVDLLIRADWGVKTAEEIARDEPMPPLQGLEKFIEKDTRKN